MDNWLEGFPSRADALVATLDSARKKIDEQQQEIETLHHSRDVASDGLCGMMKSRDEYITIVVQLMAERDALRDKLATCEAANIAIRDDCDEWKRRAIKAVHEIKIISTDARAVVDAAEWFEEE